MGLNKKDFFKVSFITLLFLGLIIAWLAFGDRGFIHLYQMEKERQIYIERIKKLEKANQDLLEQIERLRNDRDYIEKEARRELGLVKEDELIYRFNRKEDQTDPLIEPEKSDD